MLIDTLILYASQFQRNFEIQLSSFELWFITKKNLFVPKIPE